MKKHWKALTYCVAVFGICAALVLAISYSAGGDQVGNHSMIRIGYDEEFGVACYRSTVVSGIACVKVR